jgi:ABC-type uncharacterized transport system permease subunit
MVEVGAKPLSRRTARARARIRMAPETVRTLHALPKGDALTTAQLFIALAAIIFGKWRPGWAFAACLLFGFGFALAIPLQREADVSENLVSAFPYLLTLVALVGLIGRSIPPAAIGRPYVKQ